MKKEQENNEPDLTYRLLRILWAVLLLALVSWGCYNLFLILNNWFIPKIENNDVRLFGKVILNFFLFLFCFPIICHRLGYILRMIRYALDDSEEGRDRLSAAIGAYKDAWERESKR